MDISQKDLRDLTYAKELLEYPSLAARLANYVGAPIEKGLTFLPGPWAGLVNRGTKASLSRALDFAVSTMDDRPKLRPLNAFHKGFAATTGAAGGAFGLASLPIELPISTIIILRSIADIARSEGENIKLLETKLACLEVFALGGKTHIDKATETGYFAVRGALARAVSDAVSYVARRGVIDRSAPVLVRFISAIAGRFSAVVTQKIAAQAVPIIGAVGGAVINTVFIDHFQDVARGHFIIRRLERTYAPEDVRRQYELL